MLRARPRPHTPPPSCTYIRLLSPTFADKAGMMPIPGGTTPAPRPRRRHPSPGGVNKRQHSSTNVNIVRDRGGHPRDRPRTRGRRASCKTREASAFLIIPRLFSSSGTPPPGLLSSSSPADLGFPHLFRGAVRERRAAPCRRPDTRVRRNSMAEIHNHKQRVRRARWHAARGPIRAMPLHRTKQKLCQQRKCRADRWRLILV